MAEQGKEDKVNQGDRTEDRRSMLSSLFMAGGLTAGYGCWLAYAARFFVPGETLPKSWLYVAKVHEISKGSSIHYTSPAGETVIVTRLGDSGEVDDFIALSNVCPHLGCRVHWDSLQDRFICPCHNGQFDRTGLPLAGPPKQANQRLKRYPLKIEKGLLFIYVPIRLVT